MRVTLFTLTIICCHMKPTYSIFQFETETDFHIFVPGGGGINIWGCCCLLWPGPGGNAQKGQGKCSRKFAWLGSTSSLRNVNNSYLQVSVCSVCPCILFAFPHVKPSSFPFNEVMNSTYNTNIQTYNTEKTLSNGFILAFSQLAETYIITCVVYTFLFIFHHFQKQCPSHIFFVL